MTCTPGRKGNPSGTPPGQPTPLCSWARETLTPTSLQPGWAPLCLSAHLVTYKLWRQTPVPFWNCLSFIHHAEPGFLTFVKLRWV